MFHHLKGEDGLSMCDGSIKFENKLYSVFESSFSLFHFKGSSEVCILNESMSEVERDC